MANSQVYLVSFAILLIILIRVGSENERHFLQHSLFLGLIVSTMLAIVTEALTWLVDGIPGETARFWGNALNVMNFVVIVFPLFLWGLYVNYQVYQDLGRFRTMVWIFSGLTAVNAVVSFLSPFGKLYFYLDERNVYHRGDDFWLAVILYFGTLIYAIALPLIHFKDLPKRVRLPLILFSLPSVIGVLLQGAFFGLATTWPGIALSLLIVYTSLQNQILTSDYLTGLYNRRQLDNYLQHRIKGKNAVRLMAALMIDINRFKSINDSFGHHIGDQALECTAAILRKVFHHEDFIARYAGDEFVVIVELRHEEDLEKILARLKSQFLHFNEVSGQPFKLDVSVGSCVYDPKRGQSADDFLKEADLAMYREKGRM
jgi:diguanylate cyclase (GGDEF)-like protein